MYEELCRKTITAYKNAKIEFEAEVERVRQEVNMSHRLAEEIGRLYLRFYESGIRQEFYVLRNEAMANQESERIFRSVHLSVFFNINISPENL